MSSFASARRRRTAHLIAQAVLVLTLVAGLNYLATRHVWRFDLSRHTRHSLSPETRSYLRELGAPVKIVVTLTDDTEEEAIRHAYQDLRVLLRDYSEISAAANPDAPVTHEFIDVYKNRAASREYGIEIPNTILVLSGKNRRLVDLKDIYLVKDDQKVAFTGEQALTAAILDVSRSDRPLVGFITGHGELDPALTDPALGLSAFRDQLQLRNFNVAVLDLAQPSHRDFAQKAAVLVVAAPQGSYSPEEQEFLRRYLSDSAGRVLALINPYYPHGLDALLLDWGVLADDAVILDTSPEGRTDNGDLVLGPASGHPIVSALYDNKIALRFGPSRPVRPDPGRSLDPGLSVQELVGASPTAWGERGYRQKGPYVFDAGTDLAPRLSVGAAAERASPKGQLPFTVRGGRLVVFGNGDWLANARLSAGGNLSLALGSINWLADRDTQLQLAPRPIKTFQLSLTSAQLGRLRLTLLLALPALTALLGLLVYWNRRR